MRISLIATPDFASCLDRITKLPNLGLCSLAGNLEGCEVKIVDLVAATRHIRKTLINHLEEFNPHLVGISCMTFQYQTAVKLAGLIKEVNPSIQIALGGYHATLMHVEIASDTSGCLFDYIIRGEGEFTFNELVNCLRNGKSLRTVAGLTYRDGNDIIHNPDRHPTDLNMIKSPDRKVRVYDDFRFFGKKYDVAETSRGCPLRCKFCCIGKMYSHAYRSFTYERIISDLRSLKEKGVQGVMFVDDNITYDRTRLKELCYALIRAGLNDLEYLTQASALDLGADPELAEAMGKAGFKTVFLGIENSLEKNLRFLGKSSPDKLVKNAVKSLQKHGISALGGFIVGNPEDDKESVKTAFRQAKALALDHAAILCLTPYPGTMIRDELMAAGLITNPEDFTRYNGFACNVRTRYLTTKQLSRLINYESLKFYFNPWYVLRSRFWRNNPRALPGYIFTILENIPSILSGGLYSSRHKF